MPYGLEKIAEHEKQMYLNKMRTKVVEPAVTLTAEQICDDLVKTFEKCIDDFYSYPTKYYYRHEVGRGTKTGWNLYLANQTQVIYQGDIAQGIIFGWDGTDMLPYHLSKGKAISAEHVIDSVMDGIRFDGDGKPNKYPEMKWKLKNDIETQYFGTLSGETPNKIFKQMIDNMRNVQKTLANENFLKLYSKYME